MIELPDLISDDDLKRAKHRIWQGVSPRLSAREQVQDAPLEGVLMNLSLAEPMDRLHQVRMKEQLLDRLPERSMPRPGLFWRRGVAFATLVFSFGILFVPIFDNAPLAMADSLNHLEVVQGDVWVNGDLVEDYAVLSSGDRVETGEDAVAHVSFMDDTRATLSAESALEILELSTGGVVVRQNAGEVWVQAVNLMDSEFVMELPEGRVSLDQRASFNVELGESTVIEVANNLVNVDLHSNQVHRGVLGQGARLVLGDALQTEAISEDERTADMWWSYNTAYGRVHARSVDERYFQERVQYAMILPGNPLYGLKTVRENIQAGFTFSEGARQDLMVQHAENRLVEAQALLAAGNVAAAETTLEAYKEKVEAVAASGGESQKQAVKTLNAEGQKNVLAKEANGEGVELLEDNLAEAASVIADAEEKDEVQLMTASQKLHRVPELIELGEYEKALQYLADYSEQSRSILVQLEEVPLEEREPLVSEVLERKMSDLQMLRLIAAMPEFDGVDVDAQVYKDLSMLVVSLRERTLKHLDDFFAAQQEAGVQQDVYERLRASAELSQELTEQFEAVEEKLEEGAAVETGEVLVDIEAEDVLADPRFLD